MPELSTIIALAVCAIGTLVFLALVANAVDESNAFVKSYGEMKRKQHKRWLANNGFVVLGDDVHGADRIDVPVAQEVVDEI